MFAFEGDKVNEVDDTVAGHSGKSKKFEVKSST